MFDPILWLAVIGSTLAFSYGAILTHQATSWLKTLVKTAATLCLVAIAVFCDAPVLVIAALSFGAIGDWFLSRDTAQGFLPGLVAFAVGHTCYAVWLASLAEVSFDLRGIGLRISGLVLLGAVAMWLLRAMWPKLGGLKGPVIFYVVLSILLGGLAAFLPATEGGFAVMLGVGMFVLSDMLLGMRLFVFEDTSTVVRRISTCLWGLYWAGQGCILFGSLPV